MSEYFIQEPNGSYASYYRVNWEADRAAQAIKRAGIDANIIPYESEIIGRGYKVVVPETGLPQLKEVGFEVKELGFLNHNRPEPLKHTEMNNPPSSDRDPSLF